MNYRVGWKLIALAFVATLLVACSGNGSGPADALNAAVGHLRAGDIEAFGELTTNDVDFSLDALGVDGESDSSLQFLRALVHHLEIEVLDEDVQGNEATLQVRGRNVAGTAVLNDFMSFGTMMMYGMMGEAGEEQMQRDIAEQMKLDDAPTRTEEVEVQFIRVDGEWLIVAPESMDDNPPLFWSMLFGFAAGG